MAWDDSDADASRGGESDGGNAASRTPTPNAEDVGSGMSEQRKALLRAWAPIINRLRTASLPITFAFEEPGGYWAFVVRRLDAVGLVMAEEHDNSITLRAITIPQRDLPDANPEPKYGTASADGSAGNAPLR